MTFYQELQLSSVASKQLIKATEDKKERRRHILIYNFKVYLVMAFCVAVVSLYSHFTGNNNSVVGVTVLLAVLVLRQADFGIRTTHGLASIVGIFGILIAGPKLSNMVSPVPAFFINIVCILLLMILGCHNVIMYNHSTFVLGYLLLQGYDVTGQEYLYRVAGLLVGMVLCMVGGIASMSVCLPFPDDCKERAGKRAAFNIVGCLLFVVLYLVLPESMYPYIGMIGGIGVGYSAGYAWQTAFNTFGALSIASGLFGMPYAVALRIGANVFGAAYTMACNKILPRLAAVFEQRRAQVSE